MSGRAGLACLLIAAGSAYGTFNVGRGAFAPGDAQPVPVAAAAAHLEPLGRWISVEGKISHASLGSEAKLMGPRVVAFQLEDASPELVVLTTDARDRAFAEPELWGAGKPGGIGPSEETLAYLGKVHTFTGVLTEPGAGFSKSGEVRVDGERFKLNGLFGYCSRRGCSAPRVLLVGQTPGSRTLAALEAAGLLAVTLLLAAVGVALLRQRAPPEPAATL